MKRFVDAISDEDCASLVPDITDLLSTKIVKVEKLHGMFFQFLGHFYAFAKTQIWQLITIVLFVNIITLITHYSITILYYDNK